MFRLALTVGLLTYMNLLLLVLPFPFFLGHLGSSGAHLKFSKWRGRCVRCGKTAGTWLQGIFCANFYWTMQKLSSVPSNAVRQMLYFKRGLEVPSQEKGTRRVQRS
jgi:hypothetical protein